MTQTATSITLKRQNRRTFKGLKIDIVKSTLPIDIKQTEDLQTNFETPQPMERRRRQTIGGNQKKKVSCDYGQQLIHQKFDELFEKKQKLGQGAHSTVFQCIEKKTQETLAVKIFKNCDGELIKDIKKTFLIMKQLDHPFILKAKNLFIEEETMRCYFTSEICKYEELRQFIETYRVSERKISEAKIAGIIKKLLISLSYLRQNGVCHRDIKPQNIMYNPQTEEIKIIDFELSRMKRYSHQTISLWTDTGSIYYRAPESFAAGYGETVDLWAVGVIGYEMLTGKLPFTSNLTRQVANKICNQQIDFDVLDISNEAKRFLRGMLQKNVGSRFIPQQALASSFILKNAPYELMAGVGDDMQYVSRSPIVKRANATKKRSEESKHKFYDQSFTAYILRKAKKDNGIRIIY